MRKKRKNSENQPLLIKIEQLKSMVEAGLYSKAADFIASFEFPDDFAGHRLFAIQMALDDIDLIENKRIYKQYILSVLELIKSFLNSSSKFH